MNLSIDAVSYQVPTLFMLARMPFDNRSVNRPNDRHPQRDRIVLTQLGARDAAYYRFLRDLFGHLLTWIATDCVAPRRASHRWSVLRASTTYSYSKRAVLSTQV